MEPQLIQLRAYGALGLRDSISAVLDRSLLRSWRGAELTPGMLAFEAARSLRAHGHDPQSACEWGIEWYRHVPHDALDTDDAAFLTGQMDYEAERWDEAYELMASLAKHHPEHPTVLGHLAVIQARRGDMASALAFEHRLASLTAPYQFGEPTLWRARLFWIRGDSNRAVRLFRQARGEGLPTGFEVAHGIGGRVFSRP